MKTEIKETGKLSSRLTIVLEPLDYQQKFEDALKEYRSKSNLKGFRKGKTPMSAIRKMYGKSVLAEVINTELETSLKDYITNEKLDILGNPLPSPEQKQVDLDLKTLGDYEFQFDLGLAPQIEVKGIGDDATYEDYKVVLDESVIDEEMSNLTRRFGTQEDVEGTIEKLDILNVYAVEKREDEDEAYTTEFAIMVERMTDEYMDDFLGQKVGFTMEVDIFNFEKNADEAYVRKYFIKDAPEFVNQHFEIEVKSIKRLVPATLGQELYDKAFGEGEITSEPEAREKIKQEIQTYYDDQGKSITKRYILEKLIEQNDFDLPEEFLKRWLITSNEELDEEKVEDQFESFQKNLKWTLIKKQLSDRYKVEISPEMIKESLILKLKRQFANYNYAGLNYEDMVNNLMQKQETVQKEYEELLAEEVLNEILKDVPLVEKSLSIEEYKAVVKELQENVG